MSGTTCFTTVCIMSFIFFNKLMRSVFYSPYLIYKEIKVKKRLRYLH